MGEAGELVGVMQSRMMEEFVSMSFKSHFKAVMSLLQFDVACKTNKWS